MGLVFRSSGLQVSQQQSSSLIRERVNSVSYRLHKDKEESKVMLLSFLLVAFLYGTHAGKGTWDTEGLGTCDFPMNNASWAEYQTSIEMPTWAEAPYNVSVVFDAQTTIGSCHSYCSDIECFVDQQWCRFEYNGTVPLELFNIKNVNAAGEEDRSAIIHVEVNNRKLCSEDGYGGSGYGGYGNSTVCGRGGHWCESPTTGEAGNCCSDYECSLDDIRMLPDPEGIAERRPICWYQGGEEIGTVNWALYDLHVCKWTGNWTGCMDAGYGGEPWPCCKFKQVGGYKYYLVNYLEAEGWKKEGMILPRKCYNGCIYTIIMDNEISR